jgi:hypothetical protein
MAPELGISEKRGMQHQEPLRHPTNTRAPSAAPSRIDLEHETPGRAVRVAEGFWIIATRHHPGGSQSFPEINNRCLIFELLEGERRVLLVINGVESSAIAEVKRIERETGLRVRYVLSPGGGHHVLMPPWVEAFPEASVLVGPARIPRTANGKKLLGMPRVATYDAEKLLPQFAGQLEFVSFSGLFGARDNHSPGEGGPDGIRLMVKMMWAMLFGMKDPVDELWTFHVPTRTLIGGENLGWMYPKATHAGLPGMFKSMIEPDSVYLFKDARKVADAKIVDGCWRQILKWPAGTVLTYHDPAGYGFHGDGRAAIEAAARRRGQLSV